MQGPAVHRCAPQLARGGEVIRRHAALLVQATTGRQGEQPPVTPHIGAVVGHIKRQIANHLHAAAAGVIQQGLPLPLQLPLQQGLLQQGRRLLTVEPGQGRALPARQGGRPLPPGFTAALLAQHRETAMVDQPIRQPLAPLAKGLTLGLGPTRIALQQQRRQPLGPGGRQREIKAIGSGCLGQRLQIGAIQQAIGHQLSTIQQPGVEGKATGGAVGRAKPIGGGQGQQLPGADAVVGQRIDPAMGHCAQAAAAGRTRQGGGVQQDAGAPHGVGSR